LLPALLYLSIKKIKARAALLRFSAKLFFDSKKKRQQLLAFH
jgi:hypothetical protein